MKNLYKVVFEIEVDAESPLQAAKKIQELIQEPGNDWQFYVQEHGKKSVYSVDLQEEEEDAVLEVEYYNSLIS